MHAEAQGACSNAMIHTEGYDACGIARHILSRQAHAVAQCCMQQCYDACGSATTYLCDGAVVHVVPPGICGCMRHRYGP